MRRPVTTYYLEMRAADELRPAPARDPSFRSQRAETPCPPLSRFLYTEVGGGWYWLDRLGWTYQQWERYLSRPELETWVGYAAGTPVGYCELERQGGGAVELVSFGLLPQFIGRGLGGALLTAAVERAWQLATQRVWLHTCSLDGPHALRNYQARGFRLYREETAEVELPDQPPGPWPGAGPPPPAQP